MSHDEIIAKIRKVLALARKAGTEGEKDAAMNAAKRLAAANGIDLDEMEDTISVAPATATTDAEYTSAKMNGGEEMRLSMAIIRTHFGVCMGVIESGKKVRLIWFGNRINIGVAQYVYHILMRESRKAWEEVKGMGLKRDMFMHGWFSRIHELLTLHPIRNDLDVLEQEKKEAEKAMEEFKNKNEGQERGKLRKGKDNDGKSVIEGYDRAKSVILSRPVKGTETSKNPELKKNEVAELFGPRESYEDYLLTH